MSRVILKVGSCYYVDDKYKSAFWKNRDKATQFRITDPRLQLVLDRYPWAKIEEVE